MTPTYLTKPSRPGVLVLHCTCFDGISLKILLWIAKYAKPYFHPNVQDNYSWNFFQAV